MLVLTIAVCITRQELHTVYSSSAISKGIDEKGILPSETGPASLSSRSQAEVLGSQSPTSPGNSTVPEQLRTIQYDTGDPAVQSGQLNLDAHYQQQQNDGSPGDAKWPVDPVESSELESGLLERTALESKQANTLMQEDAASHSATEIRALSLEGSHAGENGHAEWNMAAQDNSLSPSSIPGKLDHDSDVSCRKA